MIGKMTIQEKIAKAIYESRNGAGCIPWGRRDNAHKAPYLSDAAAALSVFVLESRIGYETFDSAEDEKHDMGGMK